MRLKLIILETSELSEIGRPVDKLEYNKDLFDPHVVQNYHLYLIDESAEIKEGDIVNDYIECAKITKINIDFYDIESLDGKVKLVDKPIHLLKGLVKVVISTDKSLNLPQLSKESIKYIIDNYNERGVLFDYVDVESEEVKRNGYAPNLEDAYYEVLKLNSQGEVDIIIPEISEKTYTRADIIHAFTSGHNKGVYSKMTHGDALIEYKKEQNL